MSDKSVDSILMNFYGEYISLDKAKTQLRELVMSAIPKKKELKFNSSTEELIRISQNTVITETTKAITEVLK